MDRVRRAPRRDLGVLLDDVLPALRALIRLGYFSLEVEGAEHVPKRGPVVYVGNHAGWLTLDTLFGALAVADHVGVDRLPYGAVQDEAFDVPCVGPFLERVGGFKASWLRDPASLPAEMEVLSVYPEGTEGNCKPFWRAYNMEAWRTGFVRVAEARDAVVVPIALIGGEECLPVASTIRFTEPLLGSILPLPLCALPLPARWKLVFHRPVPIGEADRARHGDSPATIRKRHRRFADVVRAIVQRTLDRETAGHRLAQLARLVRRSRACAARLEAARPG